MLFLLEFDATGSNKSVNSLWSTLIAPMMFILMRKCGLGSAHLFSRQPKVAFHLETRLLTRLKIHKCVAYASSWCPGRCWHGEMWSLLIEACLNVLSFSSSPLVTVTVGGKQHLLGLYDTAGQVHFHYLDSLKILEGKKKWSIWLSMGLLVPRVSLLIIWAINYLSQWWLKAHSGYL